MKLINWLRVSASRLLGNPITGGERADYLIELVAFGIILIAVTLSLD